VPSLSDPDSGVQIAFAPDDRVLVGVIPRKRDLAHVRDGHWYRIPLKRMPRGIDTEIVAFFYDSAIRCYAPVRGVELAYRRDLLPDEPNHPRAGEVYYRLALASPIERTPPIRNRSGRVITFIRTTWDRFAAARDVADLYRDAPHLVDRAFYALGGRAIHLPILRWDDVPPARPSSLEY
jgi:hypothetical protein